MRSRQRHARAAQWLIDMGKTALRLEELTEERLTRSLKNSMWDGKGKSAAAMILCFEDAFFGRMFPQAPRALS
jgi:hypothetical protein